MTQLEQFGDKVKDTRLRWFGHVQKRASGYTGERILKIGMPGRRKRRRPQRRFRDVVKDMLKATSKENS